MERHDSMTRAARRLLCAGTLAAAMVAMTAGNAAAQDQNPGCGAIPGSEGMEFPDVCGFVFTDTSQPGDDKYQPVEGVGSVEVFVTKQDGTPVNSSYVDCGGIDPCGYFTFGDFPDDGATYLFCVVDATHPEQNCAARTDSKPVTVTLTPTGFYTEIELAPPTPPQSGPGTGTPGYWKNHPTMWPSQIEVGGVTYVKNAPQGAIDQKVAIGYMGKVSGDKTLSMFAALISAKLNLGAGTDPSCIDDTVAAADAWMVAHPVGSNLKASNAAWSADSETSGSALHQLLDDYNNGRLCAPHRN